MDSPKSTAPPDLRERGLPRDGQPQLLDRRLFLQLLVFDCASGADPSELQALVRHCLEARPVDAVLYQDVNAPGGLGVLSWSEDPAYFVDVLRAALPQAAGLVPRAGWSMLGRTYSSGFEDDLPFWLLERPRKTVTNPHWPWAIWYPLRRTGAFARLEPKERSAILREHGEIGKAYGAADLAHDVRLACHGLDGADNEFVIGLCGRELHPLSHVVQAMRGTRQTAEYMEKMGPFFVGRKVWANGG